MSRDISSQRKRLTSHKNFMVCEQLTHHTSSGKSVLPFIYMAAYILVIETHFRVRISGNLLIYKICISGFFVRVVF